MQLYGYTVVPVDLAVVGVYLTTLGALLLFGAITVIGLGLIIGGLATLGEREVVTVAQPTVVREVVVLNRPIPNGPIYTAAAPLSST